MKRLLIHVLIILILGFIPYSVCANGFIYTTINYPESFSTYANGIDGMNIVGFYFDASLTCHGFLYDGSTYTTFDYPANGHTFAYGIDGDNIVGAYKEPSPDNTGNSHGFIYNGSTFTLLDVPGFKSTEAHGINGNNIVGYCYDDPVNGIRHGFIYDGSTYKTFNIIANRHTLAYGIDGNNVVGHYQDILFHGFIYNGSTYITLDVPGAIFTSAHGICGNNTVGEYADNNGSSHGFLYNGSTYISLDFPGSDCTIANGIDGNNIVGWYHDGQTNRGFLATPCTAPTLTSQPQSQTIQSGHTASISVSASGTTPLTYQWYQGSSGNTSNPISGATSSSYTTPKLNHTTSYWVRVNNPCGTANGNTAIITVDIAGMSVVSPNGAEAWTAGSTQTIRWSYTGNPGTFARIELLKGGVPNRTITSSVPKGAGGTGSYDWTIPSSQAVAADYRIRVTSTSNGFYTDTSDSDLTIVAPTITVVSPNGGETWAAGSTRTVSWSYTGSPKNYVKIELLKGGVLNRVITGSCLIGNGGSGSYAWIIPTSQAGGSDYQVRVTNTTNSACTDMSKGTFTIIGPEITATMPSGTETWAAGSTQTIQWTYTENPGSYVRIDLLKGGVLNRTIVNSVSKGSNGSGSYNWVVPSTQTAGSDYQVRVTSTSNSACAGTSSGNFTITGPPPPSITVTSPNGGETWAAATTQTISWSYTGSLGSYVRVELLRSGVLTLVISSSCSIGSGGSGSYSWLIPSAQAGGSDYQVRVTSTTNSACTYTSDGNFTITGPPPPTISVVSPNGGEAWVVGTRQTIRWSYSGNVGSSVKIELLKAGVVSRTITSSALVGKGGSGSYDFSIPYNQAVGSDYSIRVTSASNNSYSDTSNSNFTISR